jgi:hypothetical protein
MEGGLLGANIKFVLIATVVVLSNQAGQQVNRQALTQFKPGQSGCPTGRRGHAAEREAERKRIEAELLAGLPHKPTAVERYAAETISNQIIEARRLRSQGRSTLENDRLAGRLYPLPSSGASSGILEVEES